MYKLSAKNEYGDTIEFNKGQYTITDISGFDAPSVDIKTFEISSADGAVCSGAKVKTRPINIAFAITDTDPERARDSVYKLFRLKKKVTLFYKSDLRDVFIEGYVTSVLVSYFEMRQTITVAIECLSPYWKSVDVVENELSKTVKAFKFPFSIVEPIPLSYTQTISSVSVTNGGDVDTGLIIEIYIRENVYNISIFDYKTNDFIKLNGYFYAGEMIKINTNFGKKSVVKISNGQETNIFNLLDTNSTWLQLDKPINTYVYNVEVGDVKDVAIIFKHYNKYAGV